MPFGQVLPHQRPMQEEAEELRRYWMVCDDSMWWVGISELSNGLSQAMRIIFIHFLIFVVILGLWMLICAASFPRLILPQSP